MGPSHFDTGTRFAIWRCADCGTVMEADGDSTYYCNGWGSGPILSDIEDRGAHERVEMRRHTVEVVA